MSTTTTQAYRAILQAEAIIRKAREQSRGKSMTVAHNIIRPAVAKAAHALTAAGWTKAQLREHLTDGHGYRWITDPDLSAWLDEPEREQDTRRKDFETGLPLPSGRVQTIESLAELATMIAEEDGITWPDAIVEAARQVGEYLTEQGDIDDPADVRFAATYNGQRIEADPDEAALLLTANSTQSTAA